MFILVILGSDKMTISVATSHTEYWPLYALIGNIHNSAQRVHGSGLVLVAFLAIPKSKPFTFFKPISYCYDVLLPLSHLCLPSMLCSPDLASQLIKNMLIVPTSANIGVGSFMLP
jgi:hypothetical protein